MAEPTLADEISQAAATLRDTRNCANYDVDCDSMELLTLIGRLLKAREPLAVWLEETMRIIGEHERDPKYFGDTGHHWCLDCATEDCGGLATIDLALAVARQINTKREGM